MTTPDQTPEPIVLTPDQACMGRTGGMEETTEPPTTGDPIVLTRAHVHNAGWGAVEEPQEPPTTYDRFLEAARFAGVELEAADFVGRDLDIWAQDEGAADPPNYRAALFGWLFCQLRENGIEVSTQFTDDGRLYFVLGLKGQLKIGQVEYDELGALLSACEADWK